VVLKWTDNSTGEDGFRVRRKANGSAFTVLKDVSANSKAYTDYSAKANTKYTYQVRPFKGGTLKTSNLVNVSTASCGGGGSSAEINVTNTITDCNKKGKARNVIFFAVTGSFDKVVASPGSLKDLGNGKYRLRHVGVKLGSTTSYKITASKAGKTVANETLSVKAASSCKKSAEINKGITCSVSLFPNPANGEFTILTEGFNNATFTLMNLNGATILQTSDIEKELKLSTDDIPAGVYVVKINDAENTVIERLVIK
ncbi:MAG: T9SS type A sorting domain-containing protein, partial [Bacteroidales bacterium]|nr:T9SS type A sorting domain-containing protein [Bacteroidales bacterium]